MKPTVNVICPRIRIPEQVWKRLLAYIDACPMEVGGLGTIEMRVCDAVTRLEDVVAIAAFFQAIVKMYCELYDAGKPIPSWHRILTTENKWLAAR